MRRHLLLVLAAVVLLSCSAVAGEFEREFSLDARELVLRNLVGEVRVGETGGNEYRVVVHVRGEDASEELIAIHVEEGHQAELIVEFPVDEHRDYVYPELGRRSKTTIYQPDGQEDGSLWRRILRGMGGEKVTIRGSGKGLQVWADIELQVPSGRKTEIYLGAGELSSRDVTGELRLDTHSGPVKVDGHRGALVCDTGSGSVKVDDIDGALVADTGSGSVEITGQRGGSLRADTGSGSVTIDGADTDDLYVDTGSGRVHCIGIHTDKARIDTGSGSVVLHLDRMGSGRFVIDTGSGGVEMKMPGDASATITVDTGSGGIEHDIAGAEVLHKSRGELKLRVGDGEARVVIDTGSGGVRLASR